MDSRTADVAHPAYFRRAPEQPESLPVSVEERDRLRRLVLALVEQSPARRIEVNMLAVEQPRQDRELRARIEDGVLILTSERRNGGN